MAIDTRSNRDQPWTPPRVETRQHTTITNGAHASLVCTISSEALRSHPPPSSEDYYGGFHRSYRSTSLEQWAPLVLLYSREPRTSRSHSICLDGEDLTRTTLFSRSQA